MTEKKDKPRDGWSGEERRKPRSSFVERIGLARGRRKSDPEPPPPRAGDGQKP